MFTIYLRDLREDDTGEEYLEAADIGTQKVYIKPLHFQIN